MSASLLVAKVLPAGPRAARMGAGVAFIRDHGMGAAFAVEGGIGTERPNRY
jgi:hypothetical protein